jgi:hypothetical protein
MVTSARSDVNDSSTFSCLSPPVVGPVRMTSRRRKGLKKRFGFEEPALAASGENWKHIGRPERGV